MENLTEVHDSIMRRLQLIERKVSLLSIQLGQVLDMLHRQGNKQQNDDYFKEITVNASSVVQPDRPAKVDGRAAK